MRKLILAALFAAMPSIASAQGYVEGSIGFVLFPDVETDAYSILLPGGGLFEGNAEVEYDAEFGFGVEGGYRVAPWRFGVSWDWIGAEVDTARIEGTIDGVPFSDEATDQELEDFGIDANNDMSVFALNAYYDFGSYDVGVGGTGAEPYLGLGAGFATFDGLSTEFTFLVTAGVNVAIAPRAYLGARYRLNIVSGPEADSGIEFGGFTTHIFSLVIGYRFGI
jgi:hypothetical protein